MMIRQLTAGEKSMISAVFPPGTITLDQVLLIHDAQPDLYYANRYAYVRVPNQINFPNPGAQFTSWYLDDFSKSSRFFQRTLLMHEMVHIWQIQQDVPHDEDFDMHAIRDPSGARPDDPHTELHFDMYEHGTSVGSLPVKGHKLDIVKPPAALQARLVNAYITLYGPIDVGYVKPASLALRWRQRRNYNHTVHDLGQTLFYEMNQEEQAEVIVDYFCLLNGRRPEMERYMVSTSKRPPIEVYRKIIPFL